MSASRLSRKYTITIAVVVVMGIAVTILNIQTFGKGRSPSHRVQASHQDGPSLPEDLALLVRDAGKANDLNRYTTHGRGQKLLNQVRDPFLSNIKPVVQVHPEVAEEPAKIALVCSAVLLGGKRSVALINGRSYVSGDIIEDLTVVSVSTKGVSLRNSGGGTVFLGVGNQNAGSKSLMIDFQEKNKNGKFVMEMTERNLP